MATKQDIERANKLVSDIADLRYFIKSIQDTTGSNFDTNRKLILTVKTKKEYLLFGSHFFGCGSHEQEIKVPQSIIDQIRDIAEVRLINLKEELDSI